MKTSNKGKDLIKKWESLRLAAYLCPAGVPTIGYGHTKGVKMGDTITESQADDMLSEDLIIYEGEVERLVSATLNQSQFDALVSFTYNIGGASLGSSTLLKKVNANPSDATIADEFKKWVYAGGVKLNGLVSRRAEESALYFG